MIKNEKKNKNQVRKKQVLINRWISDNYFQLFFSHGWYCFHPHQRTLLWGCNGAMNWMFGSPQNSYVEIIISNVMIFEDEPFRRWGNETMTGINILIRKDRIYLSLSFSPFPSPFSHVRILQNDGHLQTRKRALIRHQTCQYLNLGLYSLKNCEK